MNYDQAIEQAVAEGAIRAFRLSDSTAYVYRLREGRYQARLLSGDADSGEWRFGDLPSARALGSADGWYLVLELPWQAKAIDSEEAAKNEGYAQAAWRQCYTCKDYKPEDEFARSAEGEQARRNWECNSCYQQRMREIGRFRRRGGKRSGDSLERDTLASPPPPSGEI